jgi:hypothetical protein
VFGGGRTGFFGSDSRRPDEIGGYDRMAESAGLRGIEENMLLGLQGKEAQKFNCGPQDRQGLGKAPCVFSFTMNGSAFYGTDHYTLNKIFL